MHSCRMHSTHFSDCLSGGGGLPYPLGRHLSRQTPPGHTPLGRYTSLGRYTPLADKPPGQTPHPSQTHPLGRHPWQTSPPVDTPWQTPWANSSLPHCTLGYTPPPHCMLRYTPCGQKEWHTPVKTLLFRNHCCGRYKKQQTNVDTCPIPVTLRVVQYIPNDVFRFSAPLMCSWKWCQIRMLHRLLPSW